MQKLWGLIFTFVFLSSCNVEEQVTPNSQEQVASVVNTETLPNLSFSASTDTVAESDGTRSFLVLSDLALTKETSVDLLIYGSASYSSDYNNIQIDGGSIATTITLGLPTRVSFTMPKGRNYVTVSYDLLTDLAYEGEETLLFQIDGASSDYQLETPLSHRVAISDDHTFPIVGFALSASAPNEGDPISLTVNLDNASTQDITVPFTLTGTASAHDHDRTIPYITIPAGSTSATIDFNLVNDTYYEGSETLIINLVPPTNAQLDASADTHTLTIADDEGLPTYSFALASATLTDEATVTTTQSYTVTVTGELSDDLVIPFQISGTADKGRDYSIDKTALSFSAGLNPTDTINITIRNDEIYEGNETIILDIPAHAKMNQGADPTLTLTLVDDEAAPQYQWDTTVAKVNEGRQYTLRVIADRVAKTSTTFTYSIDALSTATYPADISLNTASLPALIMPANTSVAEVSFLIYSDSLHDPDETLIVSLDAATQGSIIGAGSSQTITLRESNSDPEISFDTNAQSILEGDNLTVTVNLSKASSSNQDYALVVQYTDADASDHVALAGTYTIVAGNTTDSNTVNIIRDLNIEKSEQFIVILKAIDDLSLGSITSQTIEIQENSVLPLFEIVKGADMADEASSSRFRIRLQNNNYTFNYPISVPFTLGGSATLNSDYTIDEETAFSIPAGSYSMGANIQTINVDAITDNVHELSAVETINLSLDAPAPTAVYDLFGGVQSLSINLTDQDAVPTLTVVNTAMVATEGSTSYVYVQLDHASEQDVIVAPTFAAVTATIALDVSDPPSGGFKDDLFTISAGETQAYLPVYITDDKEYEGSTDESFTITFAVDGTSPTGVGGGSLVTTLSIRDINTPKLYFREGTIVKQAVDDGLPITVTLESSVTLHEDIRAEVLIMPTDNNDLAACGAKFSSTDTIEDAINFDYTVTVAGNTTDMATPTGAKDAFYLEINAGSTQGSMDITIQDNNTLFEDYECIKLVINELDIYDSSGVGNWNSVTNSHYVTSEFLYTPGDTQYIRIREDEQAPTLNFFISADAATCTPTTDYAVTVTEGSAAIAVADTTPDGTPNKTYVCVEIPIALEHEDLNINLSPQGSAYWVRDEAVPESSDGSSIPYPTMDSWVLDDIPGTNNYTSASFRFNEFSSYFHGDYAVYVNTNTSAATSTSFTPSSSEEAVENIASFTIPQGGTYNYIIVQVAKDHKYEKGIYNNTADEYIDLQLYPSTLSLSGRDVGIQNSNTVRITIQDDDTAPYLALAYGSSYNDIYTFDNDGFDGLSPRIDYVMGHNIFITVMPSNASFQTALNTLSNAGGINTLNHNYLVTEVPIDFTLYFGEHYTNVYNYSSTFFNAVRYTIESDNNFAVTLNPENFYISNIDSGEYAYYRFLPTNAPAADFQFFSYGALSNTQRTYSYPAADFPAEPDEFLGIRIQVP